MSSLTFVRLSVRDRFIDRYREREIRETMSQTDLKVVILHETKGDPLKLEETSITKGFLNFAYPKLVSGSVWSLPVAFCDTLVLTDN